MLVESTCKRRLREYPPCSAYPVHQDQKPQALMCVDIILFIGVLIHNGDDTTIIFKTGYPTQTSTSGTIIVGRDTHHPLYIYGGREWVTFPVSIRLLKWRA